MIFPERIFFPTDLPNELRETQSQKKLFSRSSIHYINQKYIQTPLSPREAPSIRRRAAVLVHAVRMCGLMLFDIILCQPESCRITTRNGKQQTEKSAISELILMQLRRNFPSPPFSQVSVVASQFSLFLRIELIVTEVRGHRQLLR